MPCLSLSGRMGGRSLPQPHSSLTSQRDDQLAGGSPSDKVLAAVGTGGWFLRLHELPLDPLPRQFSLFFSLMGIRGQKYILSHTHTHAHTQREGGRRSQTPTLLSGFKHAQAVLGENVTAWLRAWVALAGRERQRTNGNRI